MGVLSIIPLDEHPSNRDPSAVLVSGPKYEGSDIYKVRGGYLACVGNSHALAALFPTPEEAREARRIALSVPDSL